MVRKFSFLQVTHEGDNCSPPRSALLLRSNVVFWFFVNSRNPGSNSHGCRSFALARLTLECSLYLIQGTALSLRHEDDGNYCRDGRTATPQKVGTVAASRQKNWCSQSNQEICYPVKAMSQSSSRRSGALWVDLRSIHLDTNCPGHREYDSK